MTTILSVRYPISACDFRVASAQHTIVVGSTPDNLPQALAVINVERLLSSGARLPRWRPQATGIPPASLAASPPIKSAWYSQVWTTSGRRDRSRRVSLTNARGSGTPRGIPRA
jgi:hypothetical protein